VPRNPNTPKHNLHMPVTLVQKQYQIAPLIQQGFALHQQGRFIEAQAFYERILAIQANHFDALQLLGMLSAQTGQFPKAVDFLKKAIRINPKHADCYSNLANALKELKHYDEALLNYDRAIRINPDFALTHFNRGVTLQELHRLEEAVKSYNRAIRIDPDYPHSHSNRGLILKELKRFDEALESYDRAISINPNFAHTHSNRALILKELKRYNEALESCDQAIRINPDYAEAYSNRGLTLHELKHFDKALESFAQAISIKPDFAEAYFSRGFTLQELKHFNQALESYDQAINIKPDYAEAFTNRGLTLQELRYLNEALESYDRAVRIKPNYVLAHLNRGITLQELKRLDEAQGSYAKAISIDPNYAFAHFNLSLCNLLAGNFKDGWQGYEWRMKTEAINNTTEVRNFSQPRWLGADSLKDKTILLYAEQGLGDTIQFCRYVSLVAELGAKVILEVQRPLVKLLKGLEGVHQVVAMGDAIPDFDYQCPLLSLPLAFNTELHNIPPITRLITSNPEKVAMWQAQLGKKSKLRIGLVWSSVSGFKNDHIRSITLLELLKALPKDGFEYICLQKEIKAIDKEVLEANPQIRFVGNHFEDFTDTAALIECVDLVISTCTSVPHLSCSLGKETWLMLSYIPYWLWLLDRNDNPWYPSAKLYRQEKIGDWDGVLEKIKTDLVGLGNLTN